MNIAERLCNFNIDGSIRAEFVIKGHGVMPLDYFAKMMGTRIADVIEWKKSDLQGMLLGAKYVNDEGRKCDQYGNPVEDENFTLLPDNKVDGWDHQLWVAYNGTSILTDEEWEKLSAEDKIPYRRLDCMEIQFTEQPRFLPSYGPVYITEEAVPTLAEMLAMNVMTGDPVIHRYQHECKVNEDFAQKFGFALEMALDALQEEMDEEEYRRQMAREIMQCFGIDKEPLRAMIFGKCAVNNDGEEVSESDNNGDASAPEGDEDTSTHD